MSATSNQPLGGRANPTAPAVLFPADDEADDVMLGMDEDTCPACGGTGQAGRRACVSCGGAGLVIVGLRGA